MRKVLLIFVTLGLLGGLFALLYLSQQDLTPPVARTSPTPATRPTDASTQLGSIGKGEGAWIITHDKKTALPQLRFRAREFVPLEDGRVRVTHPQAEFFIGRQRSQIVRVEGKTGMVITGGEGPRLRSDLSSARMQLPSRGHMQDVTVSYFRSQQAAAANRPECVLTMNNAYFDNETFEIATESYVDESGRTIPGHEVPVVIRGETFDFDGQGLRIRWDDQTQRLRSLTVFGGRRLVLKRPLNQVKPLAGQGQRKPLQLVSASPAAAISAAADAASFFVYRAVFEDGVVATQAGRQLATAEQMLIDFADAGDNEAPSSPSAGSSRTTPARQQASQSPEPPASPQKRSGNLLGRGDPIVITWGGRLHVSPAPTDEPLRPESGDDAIVRLAGTDARPTILQTDDGRIEATWAAWQTRSERAWVEGSPGRPIKMTDPRGNTLFTPQLRYSQKDGLAILRGPSNAKIDLEQNHRPQTLEAQWNEVGEIQFATGDQSHDITRLTLRGAVQIAHPQLQRFSADQLSLLFDPKVRSRGHVDRGEGQSLASLRELTAKGHVDAVVPDRNRQTRAIRCDAMKIEMAVADDGKVYPARFAAGGPATISDGQQQITADTLQATLLPTSNRSEAQLAGLDDLVATGNVQLRGRDGETAAGQRLYVKQQTGKPDSIILEGWPAALSKESHTLSGRQIRVATAEETVQITGPGKLTLPAGSLSTTRSASGGNRPVEVAWTQGARVDGRSNVARIEGGIAIRHTAEDNSQNTARGERLELQLETRPSAETQTPSDPGRISFLENRTVRQITLLPNAGQQVHIQSILPGPDNTILRQIDLYGPRLEAHLSEEGLNRLVVPATAAQPGRMLYIAMAPATRKPVDNPFQSRELPGATAFAWHQELTYERSSNQLTMDGDVMVRHDPRLPGGKSFSVDADTIVCDIASGETRPAATVEAMEVRQITLTGSPAHLVRDDVDLIAPRAEIFPASGKVLARGTEGYPVEITRGRTLGNALEVQMNLNTNELKVTGAQAIGRQ